MDVAGPVLERYFHAAKRKICRHSLPTSKINLACLNRVSSLARRLAINIDSLTVGPTDNEEIARMTIVAHTDRARGAPARGQPRETRRCVASGKCFGASAAGARPGAD